MIVMSNDNDDLVMELLEKNSNPSVDLNPVVVDVVIEIDNLRDKEISDLIARKEGA